jgi:putative serine protease PepD
MSPMNRTWALGAAAVVLAGLTGLSGCGEQRAAQVAAAVPASASATAVETQMVKVIKHVSPTVVQIQCGDRLGAGIVFDDRGDVVTNAHVIGGARSCKVALSSDKQHSASIVGSDASHDVAVVHLAGATPAPATFADSSEVQVGDMVLAMGNPLGLRSSVTQGIVSSLNRNVAESRQVELSTLIQTSAQINPGNSGGALVDLSGRVIGIPTLTAVDAEFGDAQAPGIGFAIPSNVVQTIASSLLASG